MNSLATIHELNAAHPRCVAFEVLGTPRPKGSSRAFYQANLKRAIIVKDNDAKQRNWESAVRECAGDAIGKVESPPFVDVPVSVEITFHVQRPAGHWGTGKRAGEIKASAPPFPKTKPDIDKLARSTLDAMIGIVFDDDSRIASLSLRKRWAQPGREGATISVVSMREAA